MWSGEEDLQAIATMFQVPVRVTMVSRREESQLFWNHINFLPDPRLRKFRLLAHVNLTPLHIINYNQLHFSLVTKRNSPLARLGDVKIQMERDSNEEQENLKENVDDNNESSDDYSSGCPGYINGLPSEVDLQEKLLYKDEKYNLLKQLYEERMRDGTNIDYKDKYEQKHKELIQLKEDYIESLDCLRKDTCAREKL